jgi:hypothetical protein
MTKKMDIDSVANELREGSAFFRQAAAPPADEPTVAPSAAPVSQSTDQSASQSTKQTRATKPTVSFDTSAILGRPKSFYITERQDRDLDTAVDKLTERLRGRGNQKIDRSTVVRLLLEVTDVTDDKTVDRLAGQLVSRLVSQLSEVR